MLEYRFAKFQDMPDVIDFIDLVFSHVRVPHDFEFILPKAYGEGRDTSDVHAIAVRDGRVRGCLGSYPLQQTMAGETLNIGYIGSMAVHRHERGAGVMKELIKMQIERAKEIGMDMLLLGGQRQRYEYHGFYPCGGNYRYYVSSPTVRHGLRAIEPALDFEKLVDGADAVAHALALYSKQPVAGARTLDNFVATASSYWAQPWTILQDGKPVGYLIANANGDSISELVVEDDALLLTAIKSWFVKKAPDALHVSAAPHNVTLNRALSRFAESYSIGQDCMMLLINPERVIRAYMKLKNSYAPLADGSLCLKLGDHPTLEIKVCASQVTVASTKKEAQLTLSMEEGIHLLFGFNRFYAPAAPTPAGWFPLPMSVATADTF